MAGGMGRLKRLALLCLLLTMVFLSGMSAQAAKIKFKASVGRTKYMVGEQTQIKFKNTKRITYTFKSSNKKVFTVTRNEGLITAKRKGSATLTVKGTWTKGNKKETWKKQVTIQVFTCRLSEKSIKVRQSETAKLKVKDLQLKRKVSWYSETPQICSVSEAGRVTGISRGTGTVCARVGSVYTLRCRVSVTVSTLKGSTIGMLVNPTHTYGSVDLAYEMRKEVKSNKPVYLNLGNSILGHLAGDIYYADQYGKNTVKASCGGYEKTFTINQLVWSGHRGYSDMYPENTIDAFEGAGLAGAAAIETDIRITTDLGIVCMHDDELANMTNASRDALVSESTLEQVRSLTINNGNGLAKLVHKQVPTFEEYLQVCRRYQMIALIELKDNFFYTKSAAKRTAVVSEMLRLLEQYGMKDRCMLISFDPQRLRGFRNSANGAADSIPIAPLGTSWDELRKLGLPNTYSSYQRTPFGYMNGQDYSLIVGRKNKPVDSYHTRVPT